MLLTLISKWRCGPVELPVEPCTRLRTEPEGVLVLAVLNLAVPMGSKIDRDRVIASRPYGSLLRKVLANVAAAAAAGEDAAENPLLAVRPEKRILLVLISGDKGLARGRIHESAGAVLHRLGRE